MSDERRMEILRAIVQDYVATSEPVGSKALLERHRLGVSAATVRNDMAVLEEQGLIHAPHTSAGRVPTDAGYRLFVDRLSTIKPLSSAERTAIRQFLEGAVDLDDVVERTVRLLSGLTRQVAVMQYPSLVRSTVRHIELVPLSETRVMVVLILGTGRVEQRVVEVDVDPLSATGGDLLLRMRTALNAAAVDQRLGDACLALRAAVDSVPPEEQESVRRVVAVLEDALVEEREERVVLAGTANLARVGADFPTSLGPVLEALEEHVVLLKLLSHISPDDAIAVRIGQENPFVGLQSTSVVATGYGAPGEHLAGLAVLGPTRMDYPTTMAAVRAVAAYVSRILSE